jgi:hypothetical protein
MERKPVAMQYLRFIPLCRAAALCAVLIGASIAARGQDGFLYATSLRALPAPSIALALKVFPPASLSPGDIPRPTLQFREFSLDAKTHRSSVEQAALAEPRVNPFSPGLVSRIAGSCQELKTPFLYQIQIPLLYAFGGRLQLGGFGNSASTQNFFWGLPDAASASVRNLHSPAHPGVRSPSDNESYGLSLRLRLSTTSSGLCGGGVRKGLRIAAAAIIGRTLARY